MVPLTDAWLEYRSGDQHRRHRSDTVIINRELATRIELVKPAVVTPGTSHQA